MQAKDWKNEQLAQVQQAARQGDAAAQRKLGLMHEAGRGEGQAQVSAGKTDANAQAERFLNDNPKLTNTLMNPRYAATCLSSNGILIEKMMSNGDEKYAQAIEKINIVNAIIWAYLEHLSMDDAVAEMIDAKVTMLKLADKAVVNSKINEAGCRNLNETIISKYKINSM